VDIAQFLHKLRVISNVEIVVPLLPEMLGCPIQARFWLEWEIANQAPRYSLLQRLQGVGKGRDMPTQAKSRLEGGTLIPTQANTRLEWATAGLEGGTLIPTQANTRLEWATVGLGWGTLLLRLAEEEVNMLGHDYVPVNLQPETAPHALQG
jgi:hypothetical protein